MVFTSPLPSSSSVGLVTAAAAVRISSSSPPIRPPVPPNSRGARREGRGGGTSGNRGIRRRLLLAASTSSLLSSSPLRLLDTSSTGGLSASSRRPARAAEEVDDESQKEEDRVVRIFEETSPSVVFIKDILLVSDPKKRGPLPGSASVAGGGEEDVDWISSDDDGIAKVEGTGSGFVWDKAGHIVTNYHVIERVATDRTGLQRCKVFFQDSNGNTFAKEGKLIGFDPAYDLAVLKASMGFHI
uniref:Protease Do-like 5, chloroplastic n=1 Tax=Anthurium amnicola TaxID=1678845 RepID=A0A1D1XTX3_9ARAE